MANAWIIRVFKTEAGWRALKPVYSKTFKGKPLLTTRALFRGAEIQTPGGHFEIECTREREAATPEAWTMTRQPRGAGASTTEVESDGRWHCRDRA